MRLFLPPSRLKAELRAGGSCPMRLFLPASRLKAERRAGGSCPAAVPAPKPAQGGTTNSRLAGGWRRRGDLGLLKIHALSAIDPDDFSSCSSCASW